ncbi:Invertebrate-type lysozyme 6 [Caenorhabditis elegans]|uniref:Invertebrate-type lysozyme 6 n=1 Tax=Caenorhabditis elegans TaxID=6239 RepID=ILYS6_CAEEL|nr:Invertebrate-type lysozyme 6 [Caenorhabditis elegans]O02119.3 RecName: Full=Invertebrate-type lysozyme 6; AltName: Full=1,4-beta-N-acetylmuramidase; Flags: Precursor [Caenorhabditis elegans]CCD66766.1 Invertebrate-type lysozyme 6 [Caenorhabditis elegans]|eukprot:NP_500470.2 Invertebrate-type lysozyme 6 [Caenorhabditis elegans]
MFVKLCGILAFAVTYASSDCLQCICKKESECKPVGCNDDVGSLSCGYYQIKLSYYKDCGQPGKRAGESVEAAWRRCSDELDCASTCVQSYYNRYKKQCAGTGQGACEIMARNHNGGPRGCKKSATLGYWNGIKGLGCS